MEGEKNKEFISLKRRKKECLFVNELEFRIIYYFGIFLCINETVTLLAQGKQLRLCVKLGL